MTHQHPLLEEKKSTIANANKGVFAKTAIATGVVLFNYDCEPMYYPPELHLDREYRFDVESKTFGARMYDLGGMINDTVDFRPLTKDESIALFNGSPPRHSLQHNCRFVHSVVTKKMQIVAIRDIAAGDELFVDYGANYWVPRYIKARFITGVASFKPLS